MRKSLTLIIPLFIFISCNKPNYEGEVEEVSMVKIVPSKVQESAAVGNQNAAVVSDSKIISDTSKKIIKIGELRFETKNVLLARKTIVAATKKLGGYISAENESGYENERKEYTLNLKVPSNNFDALLQAISTAADHIDSKNIRIEDVSTEYIDIKSRLQNKKLLEKRYLELLSKASKITDMLAIENKLSTIRSEIESVEGQFLHMQKQIAYSSLDVTFYSKSIAQETGKGFVYELWYALSKGWEFLKNLFFGMLSLWPLIIGIIVLYWWFKRYKRKKRAEIFKQESKD